MWPPCDILCISLLLERRYGHSYEISCFSFTNASILIICCFWWTECWQEDFQHVNCCEAAQSSARNDFWTPGEILMGKVLHIIQGRNRNRYRPSISFRIFATKRARVQTPCWQSLSFYDKKWIVWSKCLFSQTNLQQPSLTLLSANPSDKRRCAGNRLFEVIGLSLINSWWF